MSKIREAISFFTLNMPYIKLSMYMFFTLGDSVPVIPSWCWTLRLRAVSKVTIQLVCLPPNLPYIFIKQKTNTNHNPETVISFKKKKIGIVAIFTHSLFVYLIYIYIFPICSILLSELNSQRQDTQISIYTCLFF